ncbi:MAG TPA: ribonuclease P protein component [Acidimicrobiales bacterium]|nr:ribonuclease P protein component [Acidimicrobiales bacterium]
MIWRIRDRATFEALRRSGSRSRDGAITVTYCGIRGPGPARVAYAVGKRVGGAVVRNRLRRRLRAAAAEITDLTPGAYLVRVAPEAAALSYEDLKAQVTRAMTTASGDRRP